MRVVGLALIGLIFAMVPSSSVEACWRGDGECHWCARKRARAEARANYSGIANDPGQGVQQMVPLDLGSLLQLLQLGRNISNVVKPGLGDNDRLQRIEELLKNRVQKNDEADAEQTKTFVEFANDLEERLRQIEAKIDRNSESLERLEAELSDQVGDILSDTLEDDGFLDALRDALAQDSTEMSPDGDGESFSPTHRVKRTTTKAEVYDGPNGNQEIDGLSGGVEVRSEGEATNGRVAITYEKDGELVSGYAKASDLESL